MSVLRVYDPDECDEHGVPLDWEECRECGGEPNRQYRGPFCSQCEDHGSLKAAVLARKLGWRTGHSAPLPVARCEDCSHPMSEGTWEHTKHARKLPGLPPIPPVPEFPKEEFRTIARVLSQGGFDGTFVTEGFYAHYSRCDRMCQHGGPVRFTSPSGMTVEREITAGSLAQVLPEDGLFEASWRPVDVRTLGWPHDLRPDKLAVLCLRCLAERGS